MEYKIEKNVPVARASGHQFDKTQPEYVAMTKMKVGESFEFPRERMNNVHNVRVYLRKNGSPLCFFSTSRDRFWNDQKLKVGRCWRVDDNSRVKRSKPKK